MTAYPCPFCATTADLASGCPGCGRGPDPEAAEVIRLTEEIGPLTARVDQALREYQAAAAELTSVQQRRNALALRVRARTSAPVPAPSPATVEKAVEKKVPAIAVQSVLFVLGGLLLGTGAIVFTAVAWAVFGVLGRAAILAVVTVLALGAPVLALRRGLTATAETFAAVGLLLVLLDGYAAWSVDLAGVASWPRSTYAATVCAGTGVVAAGYASATRLTGPRFTALLVAQPVIPLAVVELSPSAAGWALVLSTVAAANLAALRFSRVAGWICHGLALAAAAGYALWAELVADSTGTAALAGGTLLATALVLTAGAAVAGQRLFREIAGGVLVGALVVAVARLLALTWPDLTLVLVALTVAAAAGLVSFGRWLGPWLGAVTCLAGIGLLVGPLTIAAAAHSAGLADEERFDWQLPVAVAVLVSGLIALLTTRPRARKARPYAVVAGGLLTALAVPAGLGMFWWSTAALDLTVAAGLAMVAVTSRPASLGYVRAGAAAVLILHAILVGRVSSAGMACVLGAVALIGVSVAALGHHRSTVDALGGVALGLGIMAWQGAAAAALQAGQLEPWWAARGTMAAAAVLPVALVAVRRWWPEYLSIAAGAAGGVIGVVGLWPYGGGESGAVYASIGALLVALVALVGPRWLAAVGVPLGLRVAVGVSPALWAVLGSPYRWLGVVWSGAPDGSGLSIVDAIENAVALAVLAVAVALLGRSWGLMVAALALLVGLVAIDAPWPVVPATSLVLGLAGALAVALRRTHDLVLLLAVPLAGAGLAGTLPAEATTLAGLGLVTAAGAAAGASGRTLTSRICGWLVSVAAAVTFAVAAAFATGVDRPSAAFWALAAAALALTLGGLLRGPESRAVDAAAQAGAVVALLLTLGEIGHAAAVCTLWGVALGVRAFWPSVNRTLGGAAAGCELLAWWLLLVSHQVALVEAYTLPAALVALLAGVVVRRAGRPVGSWMAYGPALGAAFLPSLASILADPDPPLRRLAVGLGAVAVVLIGGERRQQAPVVVGGAVLAVVALRELALVWQLLPTWIPLTTAGLLLVWLAVSYERRRRDLARLRQTMNRMT